MIKKRFCTMSGQSTAEQGEQQNIEAMGPELARLFYQLGIECNWLHWKWGEYVTLFGTKPERIALLNDAAASFFWIVETSLREDILLHIARLVEPPKLGRKGNLTLQLLPNIVEMTIRTDTKKLLQTCRTKCKFARDWRNRHIAHRDLRLALGKTAKPLEQATRRAVREAIDSITALLNKVELHYLGFTMEYGITGPLRGAEALLYVLRDGLQAEARRQQRLESGNLEPKDWDPPPEL